MERERTEVTVLLRCRHCRTAWRLTATEFLRQGGRPPGLTCHKCDGHNVEKIEVT